jgi:pilus assembly protein CpaC
VADNIILRCVAKSSGEAKQALDMARMFVGAGSQGETTNVVSALTIAAREQVTLRVRIAEVKRDVLKQLGVDYNTAFSAGSFIAGMYTGNPMSLNGTLASSDFSSGIPINPISGLGGPTGVPASRLAYGNSVDAVVRAMERDGLLRTLAEPTLTAISGESAKFLAGGEFPIVTAIDQDGTRQVEFKEFGVGLGFSPVVLSEGRISLKINTEVSEPGGSSGVAGISGLKSRKAETTVELPSGGSMIMAGMIQEDTRQAINGLPGAKNLPVLGQLFRSNDFQQSQTELTVMVTPYIVKPVNERELVSPIDKLSVATDRQSYLFGRLNKVYGVQGGTTKGGSTYHGNVGFIVE